MSVCDIIKSDRTLRFFRYEADINWFNDWQVELRLNAIKLAIFEWIDKQCENV